MCNCELAKTPTHAPMFYVMYVWRWPVRTAETWSDVKYSPSVMLRYLDENVFLAHMKPCHGVFKSYLIDKYDKKTQSETLTLTVQSESFRKLFSHWNF